MAQIRLSAPALGLARIITFDDQHMQRIIDGWATAHHYRATIDGPLGDPIPNPQSKADFFARTLWREIKRVAIRQEDDKNIRERTPPPDIPATET